MISLLRRLIWKELYELARQPWVLIGTFLVPLYLLFVATTFVQNDAPTRVVVAYPGGESGRLMWQIEDLSRIDGIEPVFLNNDRDINRLMAEHDATLGIVLSEDDNPTFVERSATRYERRLNFELAARLHQDLRGGNPWFTEAAASFIRDGGARVDLRHLSLMSGLDSQIFIPRFLALITVFVATVLATRSMLRELESRTLPLLMTLPRSSWGMVVLAKLVFVAILTTTVMAFLLLTLQPVFGFFLRPGIIGIFGALLLAALASACIGLSLALLGRSTVQAYLSVSVYLIANLVLTGFVLSLNDLHGSGETILRALFPLTYLRPVLEGWLFFGEPANWRTADLLALGAHAGASLILLAAVARGRQKQF